MTAGFPSRELERSEFFSFFNARVVERLHMDDGSTVLVCKPGGFQEHIDIRFNVDPLGNIVESILVLDRTWIGSPSSLNVFANDITKSFIDLAVRGTDRWLVQPIIDATWHARGTRDTVHEIDGPEPRIEAGDNERQFLDVYTGFTNAFEVMLEETTIHAMNVVEGGKERLVLRIHAGKKP